MSQKSKRTIRGLPLSPTKSDDADKISQAGIYPSRRFEKSNAPAASATEVQAAKDWVDYNIK